MASLGKRSLYWAVNLTGWGAYCTLTALIMEGEGTLTEERLTALLVAFPIGVLLSHLLREVYIRMGWSDLSIGALIPRVLLTVLLFGSVFFLLHGLSLGAFGSPEDLPWRMALFDAFQSIVNWSLLFSFWSAIYLAYRFFEDRRRKEIEALEWEASKTEMELKQLKDQLDPHFMFNCLNSIRALVEEDPQKAKRAIGKLSSTLRNSLLLSRKDTVPLREELEVVKDHLELERIRLEERLDVRIEVPEELLDQAVPPLLLQSLVENGVKHGISKIPEGGTLWLKAWWKGDSWMVEVSNPLPEMPQKEGDGAQGTGTGSENARKRLHLLFGEQAHLKREEKDRSVRTFIELPLRHVPENDDHR